MKISKVQVRIIESIRSGDTLYKNKYDWLFLLQPNGMTSRVSAASLRALIASGIMAIDFIQEQEEGRGRIYYKLTELGQTIKLQ